MSTQIHPTAVVHPEAQLGVDVTIGPYSVIGPKVRIGDRTRLGPHVVVDGVTRIGSDNFVVGQANLGGPPQDLSYKNEPTMLEIGDRNTIREFVTINRGTVKGGALTRVGDDCLFMACSHVAHDCEVENRVIMANCVLLAGHCFVGQGANISGAAAAHHFVTIGAYAYIGGMSRINQDVPPFMLLEGHPSRVRGVNEIGLSRAGFAAADIEKLWNAYRLLYRSGDPKRRTIDRLRADETNPQLVRDLLDNLEHTEQGMKGRYRESMRA